MQAERALPARGASHLQPLATFLSYSHDNHKQRKKLRLHLSELEREGLIRLWDDRRMSSRAQNRSRMVRCKIDAGEKTSCKAAPI